MSKYVKITDGLDEWDYIGVYNRVRKGYFYYGKKRIEVKVFPNGFWDKRVAKILTRYLVLDELHWSRQDICDKFTIDFLRKNRLAGVAKLYKAHTEHIIADCFPEFNIKPWELVTCPQGFWKSKAHCKQVTKWIARKENLHRNHKKFAQTISADLYEKYGVQKAVYAMGGLYEIVNYTYPDRYKPWELNKLAKVTDEIVAEATRWMIEEKLGWSFEDVCANLTAQTFYDNGIGKILCKGCGHSPIVALEKTYPGVYKKEMLKRGENHPFANGKK